MMGDILEPLDAIHDSGVDQTDDEVQANGGHSACGGLLVDSRLLLMGTRLEKTTKMPQRGQFHPYKKMSESKVPLIMKNKSTFFTDIY